LSMISGVSPVGIELSQTRDVPKSKEIPMI
jgi:hypothetical protein